MIKNREERIWQIAQGKSVPATIDDSNTGDFVKVVTNVKRPIHITTPAEEQKSFTLPEGYAINLFASEVEFPDLEDPVSMTFDARGRLWVGTMPSYPMYLPGTKPNDKVLILEDANDDGKADRCTTFADGLHLPDRHRAGRRRRLPLPDAQPDVPERYQRRRSARHARADHARV